MLTLKSTGNKCKILGNDVYTINLAENKLPLLREGFNKLNGKMILIDNIKIPYKIIGIEAFLLGAACKHESIGIMLK